MQDLAFTLYDLISYFAPGAIVVLALAVLMQGPLGTLQRNLILPETVLAAGWFTIIYTAGHILQTIANLTIDRLPSGGYPPRNYFPDQFEKDFPEPFRSALYEQIVESFELHGTQSSHKPATLSKDRDVINKTVKDAYWACYISVAQSKSNPLVQTFASMNGLYRGLCVGSSVIAAAYLAGTFLLNNIALVIIAIVALGGGWLFLQRATRFKGYLTKTIYSDFLSITKKVVPGEK